MNAILTILLLTLFVVLHELGHYISARRSKIAVSEFFVGFGPKLFSFKRNNTEYGLKAILLGGYVKIPGMDENEPVSDYKHDELFHTASWTKKLYIASSGILVNFFLAWIILFSIFAFYGIDQPTLEVATIGESISNPNDDAPSKKAGLIPGDIIYSFNGSEVQSWEELVSIIEVNPDKNVSIGYIRNSQMYLTSTTLESRLSNSELSGYLGVSPVLERQTLGLLQAIPATTLIEIDMTKAAIEGIFTLFNPSTLEALLGTYTGEDVPDEVRPLSPIGLAQAGNQIAEGGYVNLFSLLAFVNIFLAVFNSIPLVPLDGGRIVLALYEGITGKKIEDKKLYPIAALVIFIFVFLGITAFYLDITQPIRLWNLIEEKHDKFK